VDFPRYLLRMAELELLDCERRATERSSTQVTGNLPLSGVHRGARLGAADRCASGPAHPLVHILEMNGESYRLKQSKHKRNLNPAAKSPPCSSWQNASARAASSATA